jgi:RNA polymerase sigma-70 factor (ECF subfamily)
MSTRSPVEPLPEAAAAPSDEMLLARSRDEPDAFVAIFDRHFESVHRYLHRRVGRDLADELAAETFVRAFSRRASFEPRSEGALPWLYGIATNLLRRHRRSEERRLRAYARSGRDDVVELDEDALADRLDAATRGDAIAAALAALRPDERDAICLVALAGLTHEQAAVALGIPPGTMASRLHRARSRLRPLLSPGVEPATKETS